MELLKIEKMDWLKKASKRVQRTNRAFHKASTKQKRVMVARDVMGLLALGSINADTGRYVMLSSSDRRRNLSANKTKGNCQIQELLADPKSRSFPKCDVCAIGAALVSTIRLNDQLTFNDLAEISGEDADNYVGVDAIEIGDWAGDNTPWVKIFGHAMLHNMENTFEHYECNALADVSDNTLRLFGIMQNIIQEKGEFVPPDGPGNSACAKMSFASSEEDDYAKTVNSLEEGLAKQFKEARKLVRKG